MVDLFADRSGLTGTASNYATRATDSMLLKLTSSGKPPCKFKLDDAEAATLSRLIDECIRAFGIPQGVLQILVGFPPRPVAESLCMSPHSLLAEAGIHTGDTILCVEALPCTLLSQRLHSLHSLATPNPAPSTGSMQRHAIPADNSCLFNAILHAASVSSSAHTLPPAYPSAASLRSAIASLVRLKSAAAHADAEGSELGLGLGLELEGSDIIFTEAGLGKDPREYAAWITDPDKWGGEIELSLVTSHLMRGLVIRAVDIGTGVVYPYGESGGVEGGEGAGAVTAAPCCMYLLYDGIHFDVMVSKDTGGGEQEQRLFALNDKRALEGARAVAAEAKCARSFVDSAGFSLRCLVCLAGLVGQQEAQQHAKDTGHVNFSEY